MPCYLLFKLLISIMQFISNVCLSYSVLYLCCKFRSNILHDWQDFADLLLGYFILIWATLYILPFYTLLKLNEVCITFCLCKSYGCDDGEVFFDISVM